MCILPRIPTALGAGLLIMAVGAAPACALKFVPAGARQVRFARVGPTYSAPLAVFVANPSRYRGPLEFRLVWARAPRGSRARLGNDIPARGLRLSIAGRPHIRPGRVVRFPLVIRAATAPKVSTAAVLTVTGRPGQRRASPAALPLTLLPPAPRPRPGSRFAGARLEPSGVTIVVTRCLPSLLRFLASNCGWQHGDELDARDVLAGRAVASGTELGGTRVASDQGGRAELSLVAATKIPAKRTAAAALRIDVDGPSGTGTYTGKLPVDRTAAKAPVADVTVKVQDFFVWALAAILAGAGVAWRFVRWRDRDRPKRVLQAALLQAAEAHAQADERHEHDGCPFTLASVFGDPRTWTCPAPSGAPEAHALYCAIQRAADADELNDVAAQVADIELRGRLLAGVCADATALRKAIEAFPMDLDPGTPPILPASGALLDNPDVPGDAAAMQSYQQQLRDQATALREWQLAWKVSEDTVARLTTLDGEDLRAAEKDALEAADPRVLRGVYLWPATSLAELRDARALSRLREALSVVWAVQLAHEQAQPFESLSVVDERRAVALVSRIAGRIEAPPTARSLIDAVRAHDRRDFWGALLATAVAYLVLIYPGGTFGSLWQYVTAFAFGASGQLLVNWQALPWYGGHRPASPPP
jgi:hypothetical protein